MTLLSKLSITTAVLSCRRLTIGGDRYSWSTIYDVEAIHSEKYPWNPECFSSIGRISLYNDI